MSYAKGTLLRMKGVFTTGGSTVDPTNVFLKYKKPNGTVISLQFGVDGALIKDSTGTYHADVSLDLTGVWVYGYSSTGTNQAAKEGTFAVDTGLA